MANIAANSYPSLSTQAKMFLKLNINKVTMKKKKSVKNGFALLAE